MKSLIISLILFLAMLTCIILNFVYIQKVEDKLTDMITSLQQEENQGPIIDELESFWKENQELISLSVGFRELDNFGELMVGLKWAYDIGDKNEIKRYCSLLLDAVEEISRIEKISIGNIL